MNFVPSFVKSWSKDTNSWIPKAIDFLSDEKVRNYVGNTDRLDILIQCLKLIEGYEWIVEERTYESDTAKIYIELPTSYSPRIRSNINDVKIGIDLGDNTEEMMAYYVHEEFFKYAVEEELKRLKEFADGLEERKNKMEELASEILSLELLKGGGEE